MTRQPGRRPGPATDLLAGLGMGALMLVCCAGPDATSAETPATARRQRQGKLRA